MDVFHQRLEQVLLSFLTVKVLKTSVSCKIDPFQCFLYHPILSFNRLVFRVLCFCTANCCYMLSCSFHFLGDRNMELISFQLFPLYPIFLSTQMEGM